ncbi:MAG: S41 family peptidase [Alphaproteobacteria bacterium]|nr:S41 family peptidase [Alphaproteobacteria bacterium]
MKTKEKEKNTEELIYEQLNLFGDIFSRIRTNYVDVPDEVELIRAAVDGMLTSLDPHSSYLDSEDFEKLKTQTSGQFGGLGIEVTLQDGVVRVVSPIDDTPAARSGIIAGDLITRLDDEVVFGMSLSDAVDRMRGDVGAPILLSIRRKGHDNFLKVKIIRDMIQIRSVRHRVERDNIGYIRITTFNRETSNMLKEAVKDIQSKVAGRDFKGYVLDLRNNPGGLLTQAIEVSDMLLEKGEIVSTRGRHAEGWERYSAHRASVFGGKNVLVLINGGSASASEIVAGALQDQKRALILGTRSFGKGSVQTVMPLGSHGAMRMTTARYYTPSGLSIQAKGILPDVIVEQELPERLRDRLPSKPFSESVLPGHLERDGEQDDEKEEDEAGSLAYIPRDSERDIQLNYAFDVLQGIRKAGEAPGRWSKKAKKKKETIAGISVEEKKSKKDKK